jgi:Coenzyme PQQ synthesis protein D (PqqD)
MIDVVPVPHKDVAYTIIDGSAILVAPRDSELYWLNSVASRIWELADGKNTVGMIAERICREYEVDTETALRDAGGMVQSFAEKRLFTLGGDTDNA